jgi:hypothetical protein
MVPHGGESATAGALCKRAVPVHGIEEQAGGIGQRDPPFSSHRKGPALSTTTVSIAVGPNDRTLPLMAGLVPVEGVDVDYVTAPLETIFATAFDEARYDVSELSFSNYLYLTSEGACPYIGLPIFPSRSFRHSAIYIRDDRGIAAVLSVCASSR